MPKKDRLADYPVGEPHHLGGHIERLSAGGVRAPAIQHRARGRGHVRGKAADAAAMKERLCLAPLALPDFAIAGEQTFPRTLADGRRAARVFVEVLMAIEEHVLDVVGMVEQMDKLGPDAETHHVAIVARGVH